jgi:hypothetical protein
MVGLDKLAESAQIPWATMDSRQQQQCAAYYRQAPPGVLFACLQAMRAPLNRGAWRSARQQNPRLDDLVRLLFTPGKRADRVVNSLSMTNLPVILRALDHIEFVGLWHDVTLLREQRRRLVARYTGLLTNAICRGAAGEHVDQLQRYPQPWAQETLANASGQARLLHFSELAIAYLHPEADAALDDDTRDRVYRWMKQQQQPAWRVRRFRPV